jgi:hypothetical protein
MKEFYETVKEIRRCQREYFRTRSPEHLRKSKDLESRADKLIKKIEESKNPQTKMF